MENSKFIRFLIPIFVLGFFVVYNPVFAYDTETHAYLTSEVVKFYNQNFPNNKISDDLTLYLLDGSRREDDIPRWMNHFYDPVYNRGLTDSTLGTWQKSKDWAQDSSNQNSLTYKVPATIASILTAIQQVKISALTTETDYTWQRAIRFYAQGEKEKSMFMLGHILHLIEDASVPDHTRNDPHPGDSPYESYTGQFNLTNQDKGLSAKLINKTPIILSNLNSYFDGLAIYSNNNFYSKDRIGIESGYKLPESDYFKREEDGKTYGIKIDKEFGDYHLIISPPKIVLISFKPEEQFASDYLKKDYWSRLSTKSVQYGAGVINLFFQEVEKAKNNPDFVKQEDKSFLSKAVGAAKNLVAQVSNFVSDIFGTNQDFQPVSQVSLQTESENNIVQSIGQSQTKTQQIQQSQQQASQTQSSKIDSSKNIPPAAAEETEENEEENPLPQQQKIQQSTSTQQSATSTKPQITKPITTFKECTFQTNQSPSRQKIIINEVAWMGTSNSANDEWIELKNISGSQIDLTSWQLIDQGEQIKINFASINGSKIIGPGQFILLERTDDNSVPNITADLIYTGILSNTNEGLRLFDNNCNLIDEVLANSGSDGKQWPAGDNTAKQTMERKSDLTWQTSTNAGGTPKAANSSGYVSYGGGGGSSASINGSTSENQQQSLKILINEIQITGGTGKPDNDFIELYNPNSASVDISGWKLRKRTQGGTESSIKVFGAGKSISGHDYFLWANSKDGFSETIQADESSTAILSENYSIALFDTNDNLIDAVSWGSGHTNPFETSPYPDNPSADQSIQRKFQNNTFIDTDNNAQDFEIQTCPSPKAQTCQQANQAPSAFFVYTPQNPQAGDLIIFNAASSSDPNPNGQIISYQWNFGDNTTSSIATATTTHTYSQTGNYSVSLIVFDNQNASSTATSTTISISAPQSIVISEIQISGNEFIELYNPTDSEINLNNWSLKILKNNATSTETLAKFGIKDSDITLIKSKGFLLAGFGGYTSTSTAADIVRSINIPNNIQKLYLFNNNGTEIDQIDYSNILENIRIVENRELGVNESLERKAFYNNQCVSSQLDGEFLGNGCDRDYDNDDDNNTTDFEIRNTPKPQNSLSLPEPRSAPTAPIAPTDTDFIQYSSSTMELVFNWQPSQDYSGATSTLTYSITDISNASSTLSTIETASTTATTSINEFGRPYNFSIQAFDKDGFGSATSTNSISVPDLPEETRVLYSQTASSTLSELSYCGNTRCWFKQTTENLDLLIPNQPFTIKIKTNFGCGWMLKMSCQDAWYQLDSCSYNSETSIMTYTGDTNFWANQKCQTGPIRELLLNSSGLNYGNGFYGSTSDNYPDYDAFWYWDNSSTYVSDTQIEDIYFVIEQEE